MNEQPILLETQSNPHTVQYEDERILRQQGHSTDGLIENTLIFNVSNEVSLTKRETEILRMVVGGQTNKQIARRLSRSERTVEYHRNRLMRKMSAHNTAELVRRALVIGVI